MDLIDRLCEIAARIPKLKQDGLIKTEEGTKNALIMPFINALGYNVFDPTEVTPELVADVGTKKGEKVDYAILQNGKPIVLFECKCCGTDLSTEHASQLYRYFSVTEARFGVLTDGVVYKFFSDLEAPNKMDDTPFMVIDMLNLNEAMVEQLKRFSKPMFDEAEIINTASGLKYKNAIKEYVAAQFGDGLSEAFVRFCVQESKAYSGRLTQSALDVLMPATREALRAFITDQVDKRLKSALSAEASKPKPEEEPEEKPSDNGDTIITTQDELDAYLIVKAIVREVIDVRRVIMRDVRSYCSILIDDNNRRPLCRLRFTATRKQLGIIDAEKHEEIVSLESIDDIYNYADRLKATAILYVEAKSPELN
ncbi:MAG: restriction endonuclease [Chloroflexi bacterium]|nr:restriction endonuclease [Chloroflexota bacterium]